MMLQYRIKRYQAMGNGAMCQVLNGKLQKLLAQQAWLSKQPFKQYEKKESASSWSALFFVGDK